MHRCNAGQAVNSGPACADKVIKKGTVQPVLMEMRVIWGSGAME